MGTETNKDDRNTPEYLAQLLKDKKQIQALPNVFIHTEKILDEGKFSYGKATSEVFNKCLQLRFIFRPVIMFSFFFVG